MSREKLESFRRDPFNDFAISLDENEFEGRGGLPPSMVVAFRENRARKVRDKSSYVSSGIRLRLCVGRCQIQIALRCRHFENKKKAQTLAPGEIVRNFPKTSLPPIFLPLPLETNFQPYYFAIPIHPPFLPFPSASSHAREVLTWQNVIFQELRSTLRTSRHPTTPGS